MNLPKFLIGDNTELEEELYVIHTEFPRFVLNIATDEVEFWDEVNESDSEEKEEAEDMVKEAFDFYDAEMEKLLEDEED